MNTLHALLIGNVILHGLIAGVSYDLALVKLAARKRVGDSAFADFVRATDLGNGLIAHSLLGGPAILLSLGTAIYALAGQSGTSAHLAVAAGCCTLLYAACSGKVVPLTLKLKTLSGSSTDLGKTLSGLDLWSKLRAILQIVTFLLFVVALAK